MSYAIFRTGGHQFRAEPESKLRVPRLEDAEGAEVTMTDVLFYSDGETARVGQPNVEGVSVRAEILGHGLAKKVLVKKFKRRKNYERTRGHRQRYTEIRVVGIDG